MTETHIDAPAKGEVWKWHWLWVTILTAGPRRVTWRSMDGEVGSTPTDRFLSRFHRTGVTAPDLSDPDDDREQFARTVARRGREAAREDVARDTPPATTEVSA